MRLRLERGQLLILFLTVMQHPNPHPGFHPPLPLLLVAQVLQAVYIVRIHIRPYHVRRLWEQNPDGQYLRVLEDASCVFAKTILVGIVDQIPSVTTAKGVTTQVSVLDEIPRIHQILILDSLIRPIQQPPALLQPS